MLGSLSALRDALEAARGAVLTAPPGTGKTTALPPALLNEPWLAGQRMVMLEPRRLAARAAAARIASTLGEAVGETAGYRVRLDTKVGPRTRIEVVTEGLLTRRLQSDPGLEGVGLLIFDEFHERSLDADLALALALDIRAALRPDLRVLVMSATLDGAAVAKLLGGVPVIDVPGRLFPITTTHLPRKAQSCLEDDVAGGVRRALGETDGGVLAFLPGEAEIRRTVTELGNLGPDVDVLPLYGALGPADQDRALAPAPAGRRKVVLATTIAETSLTIDGIAAVVDSGLKRAPRFDPRTGMTRLETVRVSLASADQRRGRAGRLGPGACYRLWAAAEERALAPFDTAEILQADLAPLVLELALWGVSDPGSLAWRDPPPKPAIAQARSLLTSLGALDPTEAITPTGKAMAALPLHPRLAHMVVAGAARGQGAAACDLAALMSERDLLGNTRDCDLAHRLSELRAPGPNVRRGVRERVLAASQQLRRLAGIAASDRSDPETGALVALAYPDRVAQARGGRGRFRLSGGGGAIVNEQDSLAAEPFLAIAETDGNAAEARVFLAAPLARETLDDLFGDQMVTTETVTWDARSDTVLARRQRKLGALVLDDKPLTDADPALITEALVAGLKEKGIAALPWTDGARHLQQRVAFLRATFPDEGWPDLGDGALEATLGAWLGPWLAGLTRLSALTAESVTAALDGQLVHEQRRTLDRRAPQRLTIPSGATAAIDYATAGGPTLRARLQEMFGLTETLKIADGRVALRLELLSPAQRPVAVTQDIARFWTVGYPDVRADLRGRYPKQAWPDDPARAAPVRPGRAR